MENKYNRTQRLRQVREEHMSLTNRDLGGLTSCKGGRLGLCKPETLMLLRVSWWKRGPVQSSSPGFSRAMWVVITIGWNLGGWPQGTGGVGFRRQDRTRGQWAGMKKTPGCLEKQWGAGGQKGGWTMAPKVLNFWRMLRLLETRWKTLGWGESAASLGWVQEGKQCVGQGRQA